LLEVGSEHPIQKLEPGEVGMSRILVVSMSREYVALVKRRVSEKDLARFGNAPEDGLRNAHTDGSLTCNQSDQS
jgi:hypothetical protein